MNFYKLITLFRPGWCHNSASSCRASTSRNWWAGAPCWWYISARWYCRLCRTYPPLQLPARRQSPPWELRKVGGKTRNERGRGFVWKSLFNHCFPPPPTLTCLHTLTFAIIQIGKVYGCLRDCSSIMRCRRCGFWFAIQDRAEGFGNVFRIFLKGLHFLIRS